MRTASANRGREMAAPRGHLALVCFRHQAWRDTVDQAVGQLPVGVAPSLLLRSRHLLGTHLQDGLDGRPAPHVDLFVDGALALLKQLKLTRFRGEANTFAAAVSSAQFIPSCAGPRAPRFASAANVTLLRRRGEFGRSRFSSSREIQSRDCRRPDSLSRRTIVCVRPPPPQRRSGHHGARRQIR